MHRAVADRAVLSCAGCAVADRAVTGCAVADRAVAGCAVAGRILIFDAPVFDIVGTYDAYNVPVLDVFDATVWDVLDVCDDASCRCSSVGRAVEGRIEPVFD